MKDANGILVATAETTVTDLLCMDSTLLPGYRGIDRIDGDRTLYLQNGLERVVNLTLAYPESIIVVGIGGTFPLANLEVTAINHGQRMGRHRLHSTGRSSPDFQQHRRDLHGQHVRSQARPRA